VFSNFLTFKFNDFVLLFGLMVLKAAFNNISVISGLSVLLVEEAEVPRENHRHVTGH
jgi:hypothetical protein